MCLLWELISVSLWVDAAGWGGGRGGLLGGKEQISSIGLDWPGQCVGKTAQCGAGIIEICSGRAALNGKRVVC